MLGVVFAPGGRARGEGVALALVARALGKSLLVLLLLCTMHDGEGVSHDTGMKAAVAASLMFMMSSPVLSSLLSFCLQGATAIVSTIKRQYLMQPEVGSAYTKVVKTRLVANTIKAR